MWHRIFRHMHEILNIDENKIAQFNCKSRDESFDPN